MKPVDRQVRDQMRERVRSKVRHHDVMVYDLAMRAKHRLRNVIWFRVYGVLNGIGE